VTPIALPLSAERRRIDPLRVRDRAEQKDGAERANEEARAVDAVRQSLGHSDVRGSVKSIRVQREAFEAKGARAEVFAAAPRFVKERLWHVEIAFTEAIRGPLVLGDGRYLGLGLMAPAPELEREVLAFRLAPEARVANPDRTELLRAVRRALMALARDADGRVPTLFSGHESAGGKASSGRHRHVFLAAADLDRDGRIDEIIVAAPWACDRSSSAQQRERADFDRVAPSLETVRAGRLGVIALKQLFAPEPHGALIGPSLLWESETPYQPTRHARGGQDLAEVIALDADAVAECVRRGLPRPEVKVLEYSAGRNGGRIAARLRLRFVVAIEGPVLIGRDSHAGGGLFVAAM
jgi:CRISPR-associated protein Csb2